MLFSIYRFSSRFSRAIFRASTQKCFLGFFCSEFDLSLLNFDDDSVWLVQGLSQEGGGTTERMGKDTDVSRAVVEDDTALLLAAVDSIKKAALGRLRGNGGSDAARILDQEMSNRLLHLACRHDAVECARLLLDGEYGITPASVDARDQLTRTPLHVAADAHSKRCIQLLLSAPRNARTDARLFDGTRLVALEVALMSRRVQVDWSPDNSVEDLLAYLQQKDLNAVRLLAEKTREVGEVAYRYAMEGRVAALAMLLLVAEDRILAMVSVVIDGVRTKRSIYNSVVDDVLSIGEASARDGNEMRRKALLCEIQLLNQFGATSWRERKVDRRSLPPLLRAAKAGDMNVTKMLLMGDVDVNETDPEGNTALHWCLSSSSSTQEPRIVWLLLKNGARVFQGNKLGLTPVHSAAAKGNYKALQSLLLHAQDCVDTPSKTKETPLFLAVKNGSLSCVRLLLRYGANPKAQNLRKQRPTDVATSQDMRFLLNSANVVPMNHGSTEKNHAMKKERNKELLDDDFDDYDNDDYYESYVVPKASVGHRDFRSSNLPAQGAKSKSHGVPKEGPKLSRHNDYWEKHDYTRKIFVGGLPLSVDDAYLSRFFSTEFGPVEEAIVITLKIDERIQSRGFGFVKFKREKDMISAKEAHHVYVLGKRVEIKDAVARPALPELERATSFRYHIRESPRVTHSELEDEQTEQYDFGKRRPLPEKHLPSWFFIFRRWLPGFLMEATERYGEKYPLCSVKTDFRTCCRMELDHSALGYPKLSDFMRSLPGLCRMRVVPVGNGPATHMVLLPPLSRPKYVPLLEPYSFDHDELPESVSDHHSPRSPLTANITENAPYNTGSPLADACSESNAHSQHDDECSRSNGESLPDGDSTSNGSLLDEITVSTPKSDLIESPARKPDLIVSGTPPEKIQQGPLGKPDLVESAPTKKLDWIESSPPPSKADLVQPGTAGKLDLVESRPSRNSELVEPEPARKLDLNQPRPTTCFVDRPVERPAVTPSSCENNETRFSFFQSQWDKYLTPHAKSDYCIICRSCEAAMELVPCLHKICVACMMRCNVRACMTCGTTVSGVKSAPVLDAKSRHMGVMEHVSDQKCQLMVVCSGADAVVKCSPCMHTIACRGCLLASVTLLKKCTVCDCMIEHFKFGP
ncbi:uncharacterized protein LOC123397871 isoform X1 [Hordeum vulgare subsp. vulgare]|uniref:uncharacterized protein LOC123397871 isoform X1 n=1 Tax=Hordeum vulgare subsp. vulgare TaxID=112509 RepID=UPI001D1A4C58|nr:uncharacterized protein LOC123397871 isoform X1 [Hordeum vulgare subsp. vulgare]